MGEWMDEGDDNGKTVVGWGESFVLMGQNALK